jgi:hypothetical protein
MKITIFSPHGEFSQGYATTYMMVHYLHSLCFDVTQLHCNGAFSVCDRDVDGDIGRTIEHCLRCSAEQRGFADFSGARIRKVTDFLTVDDLQQSRQWVLQRGVDEIWGGEWFSIPIAELIQGSFQRITGESHPRFDSQRHGGVIRQLALTAIRMTVAGGKYINQLRPDWLWVSSGEDMLTRALLSAARIQSAPKLGMQVVRFQTVLDGQMVLAHRDGDAQPYRVQNIVDSLVDVRSDLESWPKEVLREFDEFFGFLGISSSQLSLPVAR